MTGMCQGLLFVRSSSPSVCGEDLTVAVIGFLGLEVVASQNSKPPIAIIGVYVRGR